MFARRTAMFSPSVSINDCVRYIARSTQISGVARAASRSALTRPLISNLFLFILLDSYRLFHARRPEARERRHFRGVRVENDVFYCLKDSTGVRRNKMHR